MRILWHTAHLVLVQMMKEVKQMARKIITLVAISLGLFLVFQTAPSVQGLTGGQENAKSEKKSKKEAELGSKLFMQYCASCHGADAKGGGPVAASLKKPPSDLTMVEKVDGKFPTMRIQRVIGGEDVVEPHGTREMPVWGSFFRRKGGEGFAKMDILNLTRYIESIQQ